jgi:hypothetical protein
MSNFTVTDVADVLERYIDRVGQDPVWVTIADLTKAFGLQHGQAMTMTHNMRRNVMSRSGIRGRVYILSKSKSGESDPTKYLVTKSKKIVGGVVANAT